MDLSLLTRVESHATDLFKMGGGASAGDKDERKKAKKRKKQQQLGTVKEEKPPLLLPPPDANASMEDLKTMKPRIPISESTPNFNQLLLDRKEEEAALVAGGALSTSALPSTAPGTSSASLDAPTLKKWLTTKGLSSAEIERVHYDDLWGCFTRNFGKGFVLGFFGRTGINVMYALIHAVRTRSIPKLFTKETLLYSNEHGLFLATLLSVNNAAMFASRNVPHPLAHRYRAAAGGFLAAALAFPFLPRTIQPSASLFTLVRAIELFFRVLAKNGTVPTVNDGDSLLMGIASAMMIHQYVYTPKRLDSTYVHFLNRQVQVPLAAVRAVGQVQKGLPIDVEDLTKAFGKSFPAEKINAYLASSSKPTVPPYDSSQLFSSGEMGAVVLHPGTSFPRFVTTFFLRGLKIAAPVYFPVYLLPLLLFSYKRLLKRTFQTLFETSQSFARSCTFLALYCTIGISTMSLGRSLGVRHTTVGSIAKYLPGVSGGFAGFFATLIEKKARRIELALYVLSKAVEGILFNRDFPGKRAVELLVFAGSFSVITHGNMRHPELIRSVYRSTLFKFIDTDVRHQFYKLFE